MLWILRESENSAEFILEAKTMFYYSLINTRYLFCLFFVRVFLSQDTRTDTYNY